MYDNESVRFKIAVKLSMILGYLSFLTTDAFMGNIKRCPTLHFYCKKLETYRAVIMR